MSIRIKTGRSSWIANGFYTHLLKFLLLLLVLIRIPGILKLSSPNLKYIRLLYEDTASFSDPNSFTAQVDKALQNSNGTADLLSLLQQFNNETEESEDEPEIAIHTKSQQQRVETLALLYPNGLIGGYRNQVMRFTAFVRHALLEDIPQLLLPSIYFSTTYEKDTTQRIFYPIRMKDIFDVDYWNEYASRTKELPTLVESIEDEENADCWSNDAKNADQPSQAPYTNASFFSSTIEQYSKALDVASIEELNSTPPMVLELAKHGEFLKPLRRLSLAIVSGHAILKRPRKVNVVPADLNCQHPKVYGGGKGGAGILWNDFLYKIKKEIDENVTSSVSLVQSVSQALRPNEQWRNVAHECIHQGATTTTTKNAPYFALHTRVELEMMRHMCGKIMELNLTKIFTMVDEFVGNYNQNVTNENRVERMFMAVSRQGMEEARGKNHTFHERLANENLETLASRMAQDSDKKATIVECGESWMSKWYSQQQPDMPQNYYGTLLPQVMNFYIATEAEVFIGTRGSSWSTDVFTTRYYQGKGDRNFYYTKKGVVPVPDNGLPAPHGNC